MKAVLCRAFGPPGDLVVEEVPDPVPGAGEVAIAVAAAAINFMDTLIIEGRYQVRPAMPFSPGAEFAGTVTAIGPGVSGLAPGDRVMAFVGHGGCAEIALAPATRVVPIPDAVDFERAAGLLVAYGTTYHALKDRGRLRPGEALAVLGASGGTGLAAVELGKLMGARVIACASSPDKLALARAHGAEETVDYAAQDLKERLKALTGGAGVDVVYDPVGGAYTEAAVRALAWKGRLLVVGFAAGDIPRLPLNLLLLKGCDLCGVFWGRFDEVEPEASAANNRQLVAWAAEGRLPTHVHARFPLERTAEAIGLLARREARGKVLVLP